MNKPNNLDALRHSTQHILQLVVEKLLNGKKVIGPTIENGFFGDFDAKITEQDLPILEKEMVKVINKDLKIKTGTISFEQAKSLFNENPYKLEIIEDINNKNEQIGICEIGEKDQEYYDIDICAGPHIKSTGQIDPKAFKLLSIAGAYFKGDEKNKMLTRIYGTAFEDSQQLSKYLVHIEENKKYDHRELNKILDIYTTSELVGKGLIMYTPNGTIIKNELRDHLLNLSKKYGALEVNIPHMAKIDLYKVSGHAQKFEEELFKVIGHYKEEFVLKPVNCPHHTQIFASKPKSYKDLPISYVESTQQHRDEKPGSLIGLNRARSFEIDDGHTFCTPEQLKSQVINLLNTIKEFYTSFGMWGNHWISLSFRDPKNPQKYIGDNSDWEKSQNLLLEINQELSLNGIVMLGEAALYGPKIDVILKDALQNDRQLGTVQIDFSMPKRFDLKYTDKDGSTKTPVMIHRAILGSYHRFIANLLESTKGNLPAWLCPTQVAIITVSSKFEDYANKIQQKLLKNNIRSKIYNDDETLGKKIRSVQEIKIPYMFIVGEKEEQNNLVSLRLRDGKELKNQEIDQVINKINNILLTKRVSLW